MSRKGNPPADPAVKAEAMRLAGEHGVPEASRRTGVPQATIRSWKHREEREAVPPQLDDVERLERLAADARLAAEEALVAMREATEAGRGAEAKSRAVVYGIAVEKAGLLAQQAQAAREHEVRLSEGQAQRIAGAFRGVFDDLGIWKVMSGGPGSRVVRHRLTEVGPSPDAEAAREQLRALFLAEARAAGLVEARRALPAGGDDGPRGLPAPRDGDGGDGGQGAAGGDEMVGPRRVVRAFRERRQRHSEGRSNGNEGPVRGEVLPPGQKGVERAAERAGDRDIMDFENPERRL